MTIDLIKEEIQASIDVKTSLLGDGVLMQQVSDLAKKCTEVLQAGGKVIFCGNGGSFADAQHLSAEFTSRFLFDRPGLASLALGTNSAMTAIGNDYGYENVFAREIEAIATPGDVLIAITTSGNSGNVLKALESAKGMKSRLWYLPEPDEENFLMALISCMYLHRDCQDPGVSYPHWSHRVWSSRVDDFY